MSVCNLLHIQIKKKKESGSSECKCGFLRRLLGLGGGGSGGGGLSDEKHVSWIFTSLSYLVRFEVRDAPREWEKVSGGGRKINSVPDGKLLNWPCWAEAGNGLNAHAAAIHARTHAHIESTADKVTQTHTHMVKLGHTHTHTGDCTQTHTKAKNVADTSID